MAAGWRRHLAGDAVEVFSGGSDPGAETNANAVAAMAEVGIVIATEYPKPWTDEIARAADVIITMGCPCQRDSRGRWHPDWSKVAAEFVSTAFLPVGVVGSGIMAESASHRQPWPHESADTTGVGAIQDRGRRALVARCRPR